MTEKDNASMTTVQMKADYAASEVYSTASEPPPAYKRQSNSVKIAKITAFTIIISSFILGSFILASSYLQARASCDQVQALDSVLEKELMLETLQQVNKELPRAEALMGRELNTDNDLQALDKEGNSIDSSSVKKVVDMKTQQQQQNTYNKMPNLVSEDEMNMNENRYDRDDKDEVIEEVVQKYPGKLPLELDLSDLAAALLQNNKKSRMNCVVERKHAEELVDSPSKTVALPFGMNLTTDPKKARITGERISIFCEGGNENKEQDVTNQKREEDDDGNDEETEIVRPMFIPIQRLPIPFGRMPSQYPLTHMPQRVMPPQLIQPQHHYHFQHQQAQQQQQQQREVPEFSVHHQSPTPFWNVREIPISTAFIQQLPMRPPMPPQVMQAPPPQMESTLHQQQQQQQQQPHPQQQRVVRIHLQQIPIREVIHAANDVPVQITPPQTMNTENMPRPYHQMQSQPPQLQIRQQQLPQAPVVPSAAPSPIQLQLQRLFGPQHRQQEVPRMIPQPQVQTTSQEMPLLQIQRMPLGMALERAGITPEDLANIQRMTEERMNDVIRHLTNTDSDEDGSTSSSEEDETDEATSSSSSSSSASASSINGIQSTIEQEKTPIQQEQEHQQQQYQQQQQQMQSERQGRMHEMPVQRLILQPLPEQPRDTMTPPMPDASMTRLPQIPQTNYGRSLANPVRIPVPMMPAQADMSLQEEQQHPIAAAEAVDISDATRMATDESARPHFVQPRSV